MFKSIRWTLQLWHAGILFLALLSFGTVLYLAAQRTTYTEVDNELSAAVRVFAGPGGWDSRANPSLPNHSDGLQLAMAPQASSDDSSRIVSDAGPSASEQPPASGTVPPWLRNIPRDCLHRLGWNESDQPYFVVWGSNGSIIRRSSHCPDVPRANVAPAVNVSWKPQAAAREFRQRGEFREAPAERPRGLDHPGRTIHPR